MLQGFLLLLLVVLLGFDSEDFVCVDNSGHGGAEIDLILNEEKIVENQILEKVVSDLKGSGV